MYKHHVFIMSKIYPEYFCSKVTDSINENTVDPIKIVGST